LLNKKSKTKEKRKRKRKKKKEKEMRITNQQREAILNLLVSFHFLGNQTKGMGEKQTQNKPQIRQTTHELPPKQKSTKKI